MGLGITSFDFEIILSPYLRVKFHGNLVKTWHGKVNAGSPGVSGYIPIIDHMAHADIVPPVLIAGDTVRELW